MLRASVLIIVTASSFAQDLDFQAFLARYRPNTDFLSATSGYDAFLENQKRVALLQQAGMAVSLDTPFADVPPADFARTRVMSPPEFDALSWAASALEEVPARDLPEEFDWRAKGAVTPVKDQGTVGSCWAFSTTGAIEGAVAVQTGKLVGLSEEFLVDCDDKDCGVFGGWPYLAFGFIQAAGGIPTEEAFPYCCGTGACYPCMANKNKTFCGPPPTYCNTTAAHCSAFKPAATLSGWHSLPANETAIAAALVERGPISVLLDATGLQYYKGGIWAPAPGIFSCGSTRDDLDHAVLLAGFGTENGTAYWTVKNSWGSKWGEDGYFRIKRGVNQCGIALVASFPLL